MAAKPMPSGADLLQVFLPRDLEMIDQLAEALFD